MANKCLITKIKATVDNDSLTKVGEILLNSRVDETPVAGIRSITIDNNNGSVKATIKSGTGYFTKSYNTGEQLQEWDFGTNGSTCYVSNTECVVSIMSKYDITTGAGIWLTFAEPFDVTKWSYCPGEVDGGYRTGDLGKVVHINGDDGYAKFVIGTNDAFTCDMDEFANNNQNVYQIEMNKYTSCNITNLTAANVNKMFKNNTKLSRSIIINQGITKIPMTGSLVDLADTVKLIAESTSKKIQLISTNISGDIVDLVVAIRALGTTSGSVSWSWLGSNNSIKINGNDIPRNLDSNTIAWTESQITVTIGTETPIVIDK